MANRNQILNFTELLDKAEQLATQFSGGYSGEFGSCEEFHLALQKAIGKYKQGDNSQLENLHSWFAPTSCWDDFIGKDDEELGNKIFELLSNQEILICPGQ